MLCLLTGEASPYTGFLRDRPGFWIFDFTCFPTGCLRTLALQGIFQFYNTFYLLVDWQFLGLFVQLIFLVELPIFIAFAQLAFQFDRYYCDSFIWNFAELYREEALHPVDAGDSVLLHTPLCELRHFQQICRGAGSEGNER